MDIADLGDLQVHLDHLGGLSAADGARLVDGFHLDVELG
jgi:hypothetical protein